MINQLHRNGSQNGSVANNSATLIQSEPMSIAEVQDWLAEQIGEQLGIEADDVDIKVPFNRYGLDSAQAMAIATLGKQRFGLEISPLIIWNCPTIDSLSDYIVKELEIEESFEV